MEREKALVQREIDRLQQLGQAEQINTLLDRKITLGQQIDSMNRRTTLVRE